MHSIIYLTVFVSLRHIAVDRLRTLLSSMTIPVSVSILVLTVSSLGLLDNAASDIFAYVSGCASAAALWT